MSALLSFRQKKKRGVNCESRGLDFIRHASQLLSKVCICLVAFDFIALSFMEMWAVRI